MIEFCDTDLQGLQPRRPELIQVYADRKLHFSAISDREDYGCSNCQRCPQITPKMGEFLVQNMHLWKEIFPQEVDFRQAKIQGDCPLPPACNEAAEDLVASLVCAKAEDSGRLRPCSDSVNKVRISSKSILHILRTCTRKR